MRERRLEEVSGVLPQEHRVGDIRIRYSRGIKQGHANLVRLDQLEHAGQQHALELETTLVIRIREHVEDILHNIEEVLLEEGVGDLWVGASKVIDNF